MDFLPVAVCDSTASAAAGSIPRKNEALGRFTATSRTNGAPSTACGRTWMITGSGKAVESALAVGSGDDVKTFKGLELETFARRLDRLPRKALTEYD